MSEEVSPAASAAAPHKPLFELCLSNVGPWVKGEIVEKQLQDAGVAFKSLSKAKKHPFAFVRFESQDAMDAAVPLLRELKNKEGRKFSVQTASEEHLHREQKRGKKTKVIESRPGDWTCGACGRMNFESRTTCFRRDCGYGKDGSPPDPVSRPVAAVSSKKRKLEDKDGSDSDKEREEGGDDAEDALDDLGVNGSAVVADIRDVVIPWHNLSYEDQLAKKQAAMENSLRRIKRRVRHAAVKEGVKQGGEKDAVWHSLPKWLIDKTEKNTACPCADIVPSPARTGYRNKCVFSVGFDADKKICVGFRNGAYKDGSITVTSPATCHNVPPVMLELVQGFQAFLQTSPFSVRNQAEDTGFWHGFLLRCTWREPQQYMAMAIVNPKGVSDDDKTAEYDRMKSALPIGAVPGTTASLQSLFVQEYSGNSNPDVNTPCVLLAGSPTLSETLCGMTFKLSPQSFFQVNTLAAEKLYETVGELALGRDSALDTTLLDVCCGTGTIGLTLASRVKHVIGVEICEPAVRDARENASANGVENASFIAGPAEQVLPSVTSSASGPVLAIVDPPRSGLSMSVIKTLRACKGIQRLVYVSCNPTGTFVEDAVKLCVPQSEKFLKHVGVHPFRPIAAVPVDLFPDTGHGEIVVLFERREFMSDGDTERGVAPATAAEPVVPTDLQATSGAKVE